MEEELNSRVLKISFLVAVMTLFIGWGTLAAEEKEAPVITAGEKKTSAAAVPSELDNWLKRDTLTGDWGGARTRLKEDHGITIKPRVSLFYQGMPVGDDVHNFDFGGKADILMNVDLNKMGLWKGFSLTVHGEYNFGQNVNGHGGTLSLVNTALYFPGSKGTDRTDLSSVYFGQTFGDSGVSVLFGKINMIDLASTRPFAGGAGIDSFWNVVFTAPPSGTVPPYLLGVLLNWKTEPATFGLWVYDPNDMANKSGLEHPFSDGVTFRGTVEFPVTIAGRKGHQGFVALYSTQNGNDLSTLDDLLIPPWPATVATKNSRYYFAYTFDQYLYQSKDNPKEGFGLFGQFGVSDGNPNRLYWSGHVGVGGTGLIPGRSRDNWGMAYFYAAPSTDLKNSVDNVKIRDEQGWEAFYNFALTPWFTLGADLQIIKPGLANETAIFCGLRNVIRF
jgi:porin